MTFNAAGNIRAAASLAAAGTASYTLDYSTKIEGQVTVKNTPGATIYTTRGVRVTFVPRYGSTPADTTIAAVSRTLPSAVASTPESVTTFLGTGKWTVTITNLDGTNAVTAVEITDATVDGLS